jgi:precorrin-8X/cobalt-precorrin-8 methylmutase
VKTFITDPAGIENKSMQIIEEELGGKIKDFTSSEAAVIKRIIHTTADFEYADLFIASEGAIEEALRALKSGKQVIVADTNMIAVGINKELLNTFNSQVECLVADEQTKKMALEEGLTRSMINIRRAVEKYPAAIFAIGNAPTALYELLRLIDEGKAKPALVIGVPVGFVEAAESKEDLINSSTPYIAIRGRKGGSTVAVAVVNALMKLAAG